MIIIIIIIIINDERKNQRKRSGDIFFGDGGSGGCIYTLFFFARVFIRLLLDFLFLFKMFNNDNNCVDPIHPSSFTIFYDDYTHLL